MSETKTKYLRGEEEEGGGKLRKAEIGGNT
jgi:hypothetical protein